MHALRHRQSVEDALNICSQAEQQNLGLVCDDHGKVELLYASVEQHTPKISLDLKQKAIHEIVKKMEIELQDMAKATGQESATTLMQKLPGLGRFAASGKIGDLRKQWQELKADQARRMSESAEQRKQIFSEFSDLLPDIPVRFERDGTAVMYQDFSAPEQQQMIIEDILDCNKYDLSRDGIYGAHTGDIHRTFWKIEVDRDPPELGREMTEIGLSGPEGKDAQRKKTALKNLVGNDVKALGTVSELVHQGAVFIVSNASNVRSPLNASCLMRSDTANYASTFFRLSRKGDNLDFECNAFFKIDTINIVPTPDDMRGKTWRVNAFGGAYEKPGPGNYGTHVRLRVLIDMNAARNGKLRPVDGSNVEASIEHRIRPELPTKA